MARGGGNSGGQNPEFILREFQGMNVLNGREAINDDEFYWCENVIPVAPAAAYPVQSALKLSAQIISAETSVPTYTMSFAIEGISYIFVVFKASGNAYVCNLSLGSPLFILGGLTSGQTYATQYSNQGILIIDPTGYWDWGVTTPNTLTPQNNTVSGLTLLDSNSVAGGTSLKQQITTASGVGATFQAVYQVTTVTVASAGTGYAVGDTIHLTDGSPTDAATIVVASVGGAGDITGIALSDGGSYPGPTSPTPVPTGPTGTVTTTTGAGTGATFTVTIIVTSMNVLTQGTGYANTDSVQDELSGGMEIDFFQIQSSGVIGGQSIATYAGRVWIASVRSVFFTDVDSYNSFGGVGGFFTINDAYLHNNITVLYAANNYLYIFGDTSVDALSNVTVSAGVTSFSRINVTTSVGTVESSSVFGYYRAILFFHPSGIYLLAGATPERISDKISDIVKAQAGGGVYGLQFQVEGELCAAMSLNVLDNFTVSPPAIRPLIVAYFRGRWWVAHFTDINPSSPTTAATSISVNGVLTGYGWRLETHPQLYQLFSSGTLDTWLVKTKLWDGGAPMHEKQSINAAIGGNWAGAVATGVDVQIDTELASSPAVPTDIAGSPTAYYLGVTAINQGGSQYLGLTITGSTDLTKIRIIGLRGKAERDMLQ